jgi:hypothetical protein
VSNLRPSVWSPARQPSITFQPDALRAPVIHRAGFDVGLPLETPSPAPCDETQSGKAFEEELLVDGDGGGGAFGRGDYDEGPGDGHGGSAGHVASGEHAGDAGVP